MVNRARERQSHEFERGTGGQVSLAKNSLSDQVGHLIKMTVHRVALYNIAHRHLNNVAARCVCPEILPQRSNLPIGTMPTHTSVALNIAHIMLIDT